MKIRIVRLNRKIRLIEIKVLKVNYKISQSIQIQEDRTKNINLIRILNLIKAFSLKKLRMNFRV